MRPRVSHEARQLRRWRTALDVAQLRAEVMRLRSDVANLKAMAIIEGYGDMLDPDLGAPFGEDPQSRPEHLTIVK